MKAPRVVVMMPVVVMVNDTNPRPEIGEAGVDDYGDRRRRSIVDDRWRRRGRWRVSVFRRGSVLRLHHFNAGIRV